MKRRGFLGFLAGGAVAAPVMAQQAVNSLGQVPISMPVDMGLVGNATGSYAGEKIFGGAMVSEADRAKTRLARLLGKSAELIAYEKQGQYVSSIDADIAGMRSLAMHAKIRMQRERNWERQQRHEELDLGRIIGGFFERNYPREPDEPNW